MAQQATEATDAQPKTISELSEEDTERLYSIYAAARYLAADMDASWNDRDAGYQTAWNVEDVLADRGISTEELRNRYEEEEQH